jgi:hypothetical protein
MSYYTALYGETFIDVAIKLYSDSTYALSLANWNNLEVDATITGLELYYEPVVKSNFKPVVTTNVITKKSVTIKENQSIFDVSLQIYGTTERVLDVISIAGLRSIDGTNIQGTTFEYEPIKSIASNYFEKSNINITTGTNDVNYVKDDDSNIIWDGKNEIIY